MHLRTNSNDWERWKAIGQIAKWVVGGVNDVLQPYLIGSRLGSANRVLDEIDVKSLQEVGNAAELSGKQLELFASPLANRESDVPYSTIKLKRVFQYTPQVAEERKILGFTLKPKKPKNYYVLTGEVDGTNKQAMVLAHLPPRAWLRRGPQVLAAQIGDQTSVRFKGDVFSDLRNRGTANQFHNLTNPYHNGQEAGLGNSLAVNYLGQLNQNTSRWGVFHETRQRAYGRVGALFKEVENRLREGDSSS
jgi:hypothetical protein